jgi:hypothetical protein
MKSSLVVRASDCQCQSRNSPGFDSIILLHSGIGGAADEVVLNNEHNVEITVKRAEGAAFRGCEILPKEPHLRISC